MRAIEATRRPLVTVDGGASVSAAASVMAIHGVGALVVTDGDQSVGIVTDRDIVIRAVAGGKCDGRVDGVMTTELVTLAADGDVRDAYRLFREHALRRLPLVRDGKAVGMLTADDLIIDLSADLADVARPITGEVIFGQHDSLVPARV